MDEIISAFDTDNYSIAAALVVADHVGKQFLNHEVDTESGLFVDFLTDYKGLQERKDVPDGLDFAPKIPADRCHSSIPPVDATKPLRPHRSTNIELL